MILTQLLGGISAVFTRVDPTDHAKKFSIDLAVTEEGLYQGTNLQAHFVSNIGDAQSKASVLKWKVCVSFIYHTTHVSQGSIPWWPCLMTTMTLVALSRLCGENSRTCAKDTSFA